MLRPWSKPVTLVLAPEGIALRTAGGEVQLLSTQATERSWESLLAELAEKAAELDLSDVRFVLSNHFVRYVVLPWQQGVFSSRDWQSLGEHHLRKVFGIVAEGWEVRVALQEHGESVVVCAIDRLLLDRIEAISAQHHWKVHGIEPALMAVFNYYRHELKAADFWLLLAEPQRLILAEVSAGQWKRFSVASPPSGQEQGEGLAMMERAMRVSGGQLSAQVFCFGVSSLLPVSAPEGVHLKHLPQSVRREHLAPLSILACL